MFSNLILTLHKILVRILLAVVSSGVLRQTDFESALFLCVTNKFLLWLRQKKKNGKAQTANQRSEVTLRDVKRNAKNVKYLIDGLEDASKNSAAIRRAVTESKIVDLLKLEVNKMKELAIKIALQEFEV